MHRYFARRPYNVFSELIDHYTNENDVVLDPFCGGGVTLVEGSLLKRRVIGFDLNPLAVFITKTELEYVDLEKLKKIKDEIKIKFHKYDKKFFVTSCRKCQKTTSVDWFEYSPIIKCNFCMKKFSLMLSKKKKIGTWICPNCSELIKFSPNSKTKYELTRICYSCIHCENHEITSATKNDKVRETRIKSLFKKEFKKLNIPNTIIPDCNMQRESALHKKDIIYFNQFFTERHLMLLSYLKNIILEYDDFKEWLLLAFSSTLRYTNKMVTSNPKWRKDRPLEWAKPGFWLPAIHLEANVWEEFSRRMNAIILGKNDFQLKLTETINNISDPKQLVKSSKTGFHVSTHSATNMPLESNSVDCVITDPPYGSYVQYADLSNFWTCWLPEIRGMGKIINDSEEAVISRKNFPGHKDVHHYQKILEKSFVECFRVLKPESFLVLTFNNREPRAWASLLIAISKAGFEFPKNGVIFQDGVSAYKHTSQSRRNGSVIGDFIFSFKKPLLKKKKINRNSKNSKIDYQDLLIKSIRNILTKKGPTSPTELMKEIYKENIPKFLEQIKSFKTELDYETFLNDIDRVKIFDSHQKVFLEKYFYYDGEKWSLGNN
tara:strand:+ start:488 stop:2296 length:1809 start_codon:yes stop_codon:yes gene_type:complete